MAGLKAFREAYLSADLVDGQVWGDPDARALRYDLLGAFYENTAYRDVHTWSKLFRATYGLYKYTRAIHSPAYRLVEFYATHLCGGALDLQADETGIRRAGSGGAIPIQTESDELRIAIASLWQASNWQTTKEIWTRYGSMLGDVGLKVIDDPLRRKVYLQVVHPTTLRAVDRDTWGNVKGYLIEEQRSDPRKVGSLRSRAAAKAADRAMVTYTEVAERDGDDVVYTTELNGQPYAWNGVASSWREPYGFVPLVLTQHLNVGLDWGWSELQAGLSKIREVDDLASKLSDQIRKVVDAPMLFAGVKKPETTPRTTGDAPTEGRPEPGREEIPALYGPLGANAIPLIAPLDIVGVSQRIDNLLAEIERDYPELQMDIWTASGDASGRALRIARQRVTGKVQARRAGYDDALMRAQQMAVAIGGQADYDGFDGFDLASYAQGDLDHQIAERPVFETDPFDTLEEETAFWAAAKAAQDAGITLAAFLARQGWSIEEIAAAVAAPPPPPPTQEA